MSLTQFIVLVDAHHRAQNNEWRHTRLILAALTGKDPRHLIPLPGDFEEVKLKTFEERMALARSLKQDDHLGLDKIEEAYAQRHGRN